MLNSVNIRAFSGISPKIGQAVLIDPSAIIIGQVSIAEDVSIWPLAVLRGDVNTIAVGARTNIQDASVIHVSHDGPMSPGGYPTVIGSDVTIGHGAMLHGCEIGNACLVGMRATILDGARMENHSMLGAGSILSPRKLIPEGELWVGAPARFLRRLSSQEIENLYYSARHYCQLKTQYLQANLCQSTSTE